MLVRETFPNHKWLPWNFVALENSWWDNLDNQKAFIEWLFQTQGFPDIHKNPSTFKLPSNEVVVEFGGMHKT